MNVTPTSFNLADYCASMERNEVQVNRDYQRSDKVWPEIARSYLIESIILGFPLPKFTLYQVTDVKSRKTIKEIVDGQQRSMAIRDFYNNVFALSRSIETDTARGRKYSDLSEELQEIFLSYAISVDLLVATNREEVREAFRRMNSYTIPLNPEEHRHASFQGFFKWFIQRLANRFSKSLIDIGVFREKQIVRMADTKLLAELCDAVLNGIRTTNRRILDRLYREKDRALPDEEKLKEQFTRALDELGDLEELHGTQLMKPHIAYSLILAITHTTMGVDTLESIFQSAKRVRRQSFLRNLSLLNDALESTDNPKELGDFVSACSSRTNVRGQREKRFVWLCKALTSDSL